MRVQMRRCIHRPVDTRYGQIVISVARAAHKDHLPQSRTVPKQLMRDLFRQYDGGRRRKRRIGIAFDKWISKKPEYITVSKKSLLLIKRYGCGARDRKPHQGL